MASLKHVFFRQPGAWSVGTATSTESNDLYMDGSTWSDANSVVRPSVKGPTICARLGPGQTVGIATGGVYAAFPE